MVVLALAVFVTAFAGCSATGRHSCSRNLQYCHDDVQRAFGLDRPSALHPRDLVAGDSAEPYRGYD